MKERPLDLFWCRSLSWGCKPSENENICVSKRVYSFHEHFRLCDQILKTSELEVSLPSLEVKETAYGKETLLCT